MQNNGNNKNIQNKQSQKRESPTSPNNTPKSTPSSISWEETLPTKDLAATQKPQVETDKLDQPEVKTNIVTSQISPQTNSPSLLAKLQKQVIFIVLAVLIMAILAGLGFVFVKSKGGFLIKDRDQNKGKAPVATSSGISPQSTPIPAPSQKFTTKRFINWFVVVPPSNVPVNLSDDWKEFSQQNYRLRYPKEWMVKSKEIGNQLNGASIITATALIPASQLELTEEPVTLIEFESDLELNKIITNTFTNQSITQSTVAIADVSAIKVSGEITSQGHRQERIFIPLSQRKYLEIILKFQAPEDEVIFEFILSSLKLG